MGNDRLPKILRRCQCLALPAGLLLAFLGLVLVADSNHLIEHWIRIYNPDQIGSFLRFPGRTVTGMGLFGLGILLAGFSMPPTLAPLAQEFPNGFRYSRGSIAAVIGACLLYELLLRDLSTGADSNVDIAYFLFSLGLLTVASVLSEKGPSRNPRVLRSVDALIASGIFLVTATINSIAIRDWRFSWVGDEFAFHRAAKNILDGPHWNFFDLTFVYETHPTLDSIYQALFMSVFGTDIVGWRLSQIFLVALTSALFFVAVRSVLGLAPAIFGAMALGANHVVFAFAHIAYNNLHSQLLSVIVLNLLILCWTRRTDVWFLLVGFSLGFSFYTFMPALLMIPVALFFVVIACRGLRWHEAIRKWALCFLGMTIVALPALIVTGVSDYSGVALFQSFAHPSPTQYDHRSFWGVWTSLEAFFFNEAPGHHYVSGPLIDGFTSVLLALGLIVSFRKPRSFATSLGVVWFVSGVGGVGLTSFLAEPHITRLVAIVPSAIFLSALGFDFVWRGVSDCWKLMPLKQSLALGALLALVVSLNLYISLEISPIRSHTNRELATIKVMQHFEDSNIVGLTPGFSNLFDYLLGLYPNLEERWRSSSLEELRVGDYDLGGDPPTIFVAYDCESANTLWRRLPISYMYGVQTINTFNDSPVLWYFMPEAGIQPGGEISNSESCRSDQPSSVDSTPVFVEEDEMTSFDPIRGSSVTLVPWLIARSQDGSLHVSSRDVLSVWPVGQGVSVIGCEPRRKQRPAFIRWGGESVEVDRIEFDAASGGKFFFLDPRSCEVFLSDSAGNVYWRRLVPGSDCLPVIDASDDGNSVVAVSERGLVTVFDVNGELLQSFTVQSLNSRHRLTATDIEVLGDGTLWIWDGGDGVLRCFRDDGHLLFESTLDPGEYNRFGNRFAIDPDARKLAITINKEKGGGIAVFQPYGGKIAEWTCDQEAPHDVLLDRDHMVHMTFPESKTIKSIWLKD